MRDERRQSCHTENQMLLTTELKEKGAVPAQDCADAQNRRQTSASFGRNKRMSATLYFPQLTSPTAVHTKPFSDSQDASFSLRIDSLMSNNVDCQANVHVVHPFSGLTSVSRCRMKRHLVGVLAS